MDYQHFFITLPSDASMHAHPDNHGGSFSVDLVEELCLSPHQWEVALVEMIFNQDWHPIVPEDLWIAMCLNSEVGGKWVRCKAVHAPTALEKKRLTTIEEFWEQVVKPLIENAAKETGEITLSGLALVKEEKNTKIHFTAVLTTKKKVAVRMELSTSLLQILGFTRAQLVESRYFQTDSRHKITTPKTHFAPSIRRGISSLWIYTDIIRNQITGDSVVPLLRVIQVDPTLENEVSRVVEFQRPHFCPLQAGNIQTIKIRIHNAYGLVPIQFATPVICKLMFRRKKIPPV